MHRERRCRVRRDDARRAAPIAAAIAYGMPASRLRLVGVTGTNGKTTTVGMLRHLLDDGGAGRSASIGTLGVLLGSEGIAQPGGAGLTTPGPIELQRVLRSLVDAGVTIVAMEVSSHSLDQRRVDGLTFAVAAFTNLTRDPPRLSRHDGSIRRREGAPHGVPGTGGTVRAERG
jgi:UDP-N-acetylmuramoyl-L-alanyl-D-glutamate--2,6-diaminopimelate ligase